MADHTTLHINCLPEDKKAWMLTARVAGMSLEEWVNRMLNLSTVDTEPEWLDGLSERARICLLGAGFYSRESVQHAINNGLDIATLSNAGRSVKTEVEQWLK